MLTFKPKTTVKAQYFLLLFLILTSCKKENDSVESAKKTAEKENNFVMAERIPSEIDSLKTKSEIEKFIQKSDTNYREYELKYLQDFDRDANYDSVNKILANKLNVKTYFEKADFDNNGYTDLLAIGDDHTCSSGGGKSCSFSPIVLLNFGKNKTKIFTLTLEWGQMLVPVVEYDDGKPLLAIYKQKLTDWEKRIYTESKTRLTFKFDNLIEYNKNPKKTKISKIEFETSGCFGSCPIYKLTLNRDSISIFNAKYYNFNHSGIAVYGKEEGIFYAEINKIKFDELADILNYCDFENLKENYAVMHTDDQTGDLKITYNDGSIKKISDYGMIGTYGLSFLYMKLAEVRFSEKWTKKKIAP